MKVTTKHILNVQKCGLTRLAGTVSMAALSASLSFRLRWFICYRCNQNRARGGGYRPHLAQTTGAVLQRLGQMRWADLFHARKVGDRTRYLYHPMHGASR